MPERLISVTSENSIPEDVLVEHIAVALRDFKFAGKVDVEMAHPFDNPANVVFDDDVKTEEYTGPTGTHVEGGFIPASVIAKLDLTGTPVTLGQGGPVIGEVTGPPSFTPPQISGSFESKLPRDPYPLTTRVIDALKKGGRRA